MFPFAGFPSKPLVWDFCYKKVFCFILELCLLSWRYKITLVAWFLVFQLALSPSPRNPAEPIAVQNNQQLALKVEGVVQHGSKPGLFRKIQSVCLNVSSVLQSKSGQDYKVYR